MSELFYKEEVFQLVGLCMEIHRELGKGHDEVIYKDALLVELSRAGIPFLREKNYEITYKGVILPHYYYADFVVWDKILFEAKAIEKLTDSHIKQVLNLPRRLETSARSLGQFRRRFPGVEKGCFMRHEVRQFRSEDTNFTNLHELISRLSWLYEIGENSCNSCLGLWINFV
jgi:GxxExxY protein